MLIASVKHGLFHLVEEIRGEALGRRGAFREHSRSLGSGGVAGDLEGQDDGLPFFEAELFFYHATNLFRLTSGPRRDLADHLRRVQLLADDDATPKAPLPPPLGADAAEALPHERRCRVGEELVEVLGHGAFIPASSVVRLLRRHPDAMR